MKGNIGWLAAVLAAVVLTACCKEPKPYIPDDPYPESRRVVLLYSAGHNNLSSDLLEDIDILIDNTELYPSDEKYDALLIFTHSNRNGGAPRLIYPHADRYGRPVVDTLVRYPASTNSASAQTLTEVLSYVRDNFPADSYGMIFSSHATGYLPEGYYVNSSSYESSYSSGTMSVPQRRAGVQPQQAVSYPFYEDRPLTKSGGGLRTGDLLSWDGGGLRTGDLLSWAGGDVGLTKSIGQDYRSLREAYEMSLTDFCAAIPMPLDFLVFDACLMSGIEVAWELRDKVRWMIASPTEILADGMDYSTMSSFLFSRADDALPGVCRAYFDYYNNQSGAYQSATIALTDCSALGGLAEVCAELFTKYRAELNALTDAQIQHYYRMNYHWFYDLGDILSQLGCTDEETAAWQDALDAAVVYKAHTPSFLSIDIQSFSGLSTMLPSAAGDYLQNYYTSLGWNKATGFIEEF